MTMRLVSVDYGRIWEWIHEQRRYRAVWLHRSPKVRLYFRSVEDDEDDWMLNHTRAIGDASAKAVAEQMYREITGRKPEPHQRRPQRHRNATTNREDLVLLGPHDGLFGVGLAPLYVTREELAALQAAQRAERHNRYP